ncbi:hypothetical protein [Bosea sp. NBC_00550]|uniref:hypothetical protein n=1 Tax=Bosea sp. NBC_00550 TaxID=2969621 RepID=UPI00222F5752|nr:hypothetical protein [Bosea sp. NBC_00550]UZF91275.1 hypothetical protein NWE53_19415 [Bosea sp. NBC_00550]
MSAQERGLARLMLRFPEFRQGFARLRGGRFGGVCEEYDLVWEVIGRWSQAEHCALFSFNDYCLLAAAIERDAIAMAKAVPDPGAIAKAPGPDSAPTSSSEFRQPVPPTPPSW